MATDDKFENDEDPLADVRIPSDGKRRLFSPRNIALWLIAVILIFFGGYFAAYVMAHQKYKSVEAELNVCRSVLDSQRGEISDLKDSIDALHAVIGPQTADSVVADSIGVTAQ